MKDLDRFKVGDIIEPIVESHIHAPLEQHRVLETGQADPTHTTFWMNVEVVRTGEKSEHWLNSGKYWRLVDKKMFNDLIDMYYEGR